MLAADAQDKLKKASADITNLSEELKTCKGKFYYLKKMGCTNIKCK